MFSHCHFTRLFQVVAIILAVIPLLPFFHSTDAAECILACSYFDSCQENELEASVEADHLAGQNEDRERCALCSVASGWVVFHWDADVPLNLELNFFAYSPTKGLRVISQRGRGPPHTDLSHISQLPFKGNHTIV